MATAYKNRNRPVFTGISLVNQLIEQLMQILDIRFFQSLVLGEGVNLVVRLGMSQRLIDITERLSSNGESIFNDHLRLCLGKAVAFNRIA